MEQRIASRIYSDKLKGHFVFLSASFPASERGAEYYQTARPFEITGATIAATRAIFGASGKLVFGGHPTISPLILSVGRDFSLDFPEQDWPFIHIYQSQLYKDEVPEETLQLEKEGFGKIHWIPAVDRDTGKSLRLMRTEMLKTKPIAGIFVGGMEGVYSVSAGESEFSLFKAICKGRPIYPIGAPGGASQLLLNRILRKEEPMDWSFKQITLEELSQPPVYAVLMRKVVLDAIAQQHAIYRARSGS